MSEICFPSFLIPGQTWPAAAESRPAPARPKDASSEEAALVERLKARDAEALAAVYDRYSRVAYAVVYRLVQDTFITEDLLQEAFLNIWNRARSFDPQKGSLGKWVVSVARNRAIDYLRSVEGRMCAGAVDLAVAESRNDFPNLEWDALSIDRKRRLAAAFQKLSPRQRDIIQLAYFEGLSQSEMAARLQEPLGTVKTRVRSALQLLRLELA